MNIGKSDRVIRILVGIALISTVFVGPRSLWGWIGLIPLTTGILGLCPIYSVLGFGTRKR